jgi:formylglycine-generating enzyme required for sulfatase activity
MEHWIAGVDAVLPQAPRFRAELASARSAGDVDAITLLETPVQALDLLERELRPLVASWRAKAADLARVSLEVDDRKWQAAIDDVARLPVYRELPRLTKQLGLVPLRRDPASGLWEFWHVLSGERPVEKQATPSGYAIGAGMGIVLVLLPGGSFMMGSPEDELGRDSANEELREEIVEPYFLSKFEVTQGQWLRIMDDRPSLYGPGAAILQAGRLPGDAATNADVHPVESVNWQACSRFARRVGLRLPRESEWEYACRAETMLACWWQEEAGTTSPQGFENVADQSCKRQTTVGYVEFDDGFPAHSPVGSFKANPFGLFDIAGNVGEWCEDWYSSTVPPDDVPRRRINRGGTWFSPLRFLRSAARQWDNPIGLNQARGLRAARSLDR